MRAAHDHAAHYLNVVRTGSVVWGWHGRTIGARVIDRSRSRWLRVAGAPPYTRGGHQWTGNSRAHAEVPAITMPKLLNATEWTSQGFTYRAELSDYIHDPICSDQPALTRELDLPTAWWQTLRHDLDALSTVTTDRVGFPQDFIDQVLLASLGIVSEVPAWATSHGDCHWANLTLTRPVLLDWEMWGAAPAGFDCAMLHTYSLLTPTTAATIRRVFADQLETPAGRFAELFAIALLLRTTHDDDNRLLLPALHTRLRRLQVPRTPSPGASPTRPRPRS